MQSGYLPYRRSVAESFCEIFRLLSIFSTRGSCPFSQYFFLFLLACRIFCQTGSDALSALFSGQVRFCPEEFGLMSFSVLFW